MIVLFGSVVSHVAEMLSHLITPSASYGNRPFQKSSWISKEFLEYFNNNAKSMNNVLKHDLLHVATPSTIRSHWCTLENLRRSPWSGQSHAWPGWETSNFDLLGKLNIITHQTNEDVCETSQTTEKGVSSMLRPYPLQFNPRLPSYTHCISGMSTGLKRENTVIGSCNMLSSVVVGKLLIVIGYYR